MIEKLEAVLSRFNQLTELVVDPEVISRQDEWQKYTKERSDLEELVEKYLEYKKISQEKDDAEQAAACESDAEMKSLLTEEFYECKRKLETISDELKILLLPKDPNDDKNIIMEIRAGAGGDEASLFVYDLYKMYLRFAEKMRWKIEDIDTSFTEAGGMKEAVVNIVGRGVYGKLKFESGVHRVQRVPETESQGRVHTSTVTVAVLPEVEDIQVEINEKDLKIDTNRSGGAGGQHVNKTESSIRITHLPTGIVVTCQDERSQIKNREKAMKVLKSRLYDHYNGEYERQYSENRKNQVGTGDRSERIRTYNFPQGRVTDHRIGLTLYSLDKFMMGDVDEMLDALAIADRNAKLTSAAEE
ncbi:MAG: peptide chain release factor 1 [Clostridia bacterium]|nr:peptide chain release factor 1 [Clostridia bacterium]